MNYIKKIIKFTFLMYWIVTIIYVSPNNYVKISLEGVLNTFAIFFDQKWEFFAPPPKGNNRLYYTFYNSNKQSICSFEVIRPLLFEKKKKSPLNTKEEAIDYIVNGSISNLIEYIVTQREIYQQSYPDSTQNIIESKAKGAIADKFNDIPSYRTLVNYANIVAKKNLTTPIYTTVKFIKITITEKKISKFIDRMNKITEEDGLIMESPFIELKFDSNGIRK